MGNGIKRKRFAVMRMLDYDFFSTKKEAIDSAKNQAEDDIDADGYDYIVAEVIGQTESRHSVFFNED